MRTDHASVDAYLAAQPAPTRAVLARVRAAIRKALPRATEGISYQIPVYKLDGAMVLYLAGFQSHYSIYPATAHLIRTLGPRLAGHLHNKATIRFSLADAIPTALITRIAKLRAAEAAELQRAKSGRKAAKKAAPRKAVAKKKDTAARTKLAGKR